MNTVLFKDPVYDELKKDQKPVKVPPKGAEEKIEEKPKTGDPEANKDLVLHDGNIIKTQIPIYLNSNDQTKTILDNVPEPVYGDPLK